MGLEIHEDGQAPVLDTPAANTVKSVPTKIMIEGVERDAFTTTIAGKTIVHTTGLSVLEKRKLSRATLADDHQHPDAYAYNQVAACVRSIDGVPEGFPATEDHIEMILTRLGDEVAEFLFDVRNNAFSDRLVTRAKNLLATGFSASP
jgi:hypothetical protein